MFGGIISKLTGMIAKSASKTSIVVAKKAPDILFWSGVTCVIGGTVVAIAKTEKASDALDEFNKYKERYKNDCEAADKREDGETFYPLAQRKHDNKVIHAHMIMTMAKIYLPVVLLEAMGIFFLCKSKAILNRRNASLAAAYAALSKSYSDYRKRVRDRFGEDVENDIYNGYITTTYKELETSENGVATEVEKEKISYSPLSPFAFLLSKTDEDRKSRNMPEYMLWDIKITRDALQSRLESRKDYLIPTKRPRLSLAEIKEAYGIKPDDSDHAWFVEDYLDFGIEFDPKLMKEGSPEWNFLHGKTDGIWLIPNVSYNICDDLKIQLHNKGIKEELHHLEGEKYGKVLL